jgi:hypothetical protein
MWAYRNENTRVALCPMLSGHVRSRIMEITKDLYTIAEFSVAVRISQRQYYRLRAAGDGPRVTILGGRHLISHDEMKRWLASHTERNSFYVN